MMRQYRRQQERKYRKLDKELQQHFKQLKKLGWSDEKIEKFFTLPNEDFFNDFKDVYYINPDLNRDVFEHTINTFGEVIKDYDKTESHPRIIFLIIFEPYPYINSDKMKTSISNILNKYSPNNVYVVLPLNSLYICKNYEFERYAKEPYSQRNVNHVAALSKAAISVFLTSAEFQFMRNAVAKELRNAKQQIAKQTR